MLSILQQAWLTRPGAAVCNVFHHVAPMLLRDEDLEETAP